MRFYSALMPGYDERPIVIFLPLSYRDDKTSDACEHTALEVVGIANRHFPGTRDRVWACEYCGELRDFVGEASFEASSEEFVAKIWRGFARRHGALA